MKAKEAFDPGCSEPLHASRSGGSQPSAKYDQMILAAAVTNAAPKATESIRLARSLESRAGGRSGRFVGIRLTLSERWACGYLNPASVGAHFVYEVPVWPEDFHFQPLTSKVSRLSSASSFVLASASNVPVPRPDIAKARGGIPLPWLAPTLMLACTLRGALSCASRPKWRGPGFPFRKRAASGTGSGRSEITSPASPRQVGHRATKL
jgi:hypothetical protein